MGTFGEIVEPSSRNTWEDWEDGELYNSTNMSDLKWEKNNTPPEKIEHLIIFEGKYVVDSIKHIIRRNSTMVDSIPAVNLELYTQEKPNYFIVIVTDYDMVKSTEVVNLLSPYITVSKTITVIITKPLSEYKGTAASKQSHVVRGIYTSVFNTHTSKMKNIELEQPNILSGISAGVISLCEHSNVPCEGSLIFLEQPSGLPMDKLEDVFSMLTIKDGINSQPTRFFDSNLYI